MFEFCLMVPMNCIWIVEVMNVWCWFCLVFTGYLSVRLFCKFLFSVDCLQNLFCRVSNSCLFLSMCLYIVVSCYGCIKLTFFVLVTMRDWKLLDPSAILVDPSLSMFDIVHISKDIAGDADRVKDWCLAGEIIFRLQPSRLNPSVCTEPSKTSFVWIIQ